MTIKVLNAKGPLGWGPLENQKYYYDFGTGTKIPIKETKAKTTAPQNSSKVTPQPKKEKDPFLEGFNLYSDKPETPYVFSSLNQNNKSVEERNEERNQRIDDFLAGFNQVRDEEKERLEKFARIRANADKRTWINGNVVEKPEKQNDPFLAGFYQDDRELEKREKVYITDERVGLPKINEKAYMQDSYSFEPGLHTLSDSREILYAKKEKPNYSGNPNKRKGSEGRQPTGARERNVGHPEGEEHSRVPKGSGGRARGNIRRAEVNSETIGKAVIGGIAAAGTGYLIYRGVRLLPSLLPALWWTLPVNLATP